MSPSHSRGRGALFATVVFLAVFAAFYVLLSVTGAKPVVERIEPTPVAPGEELTITGSNFGENRGRSKVRLGGSVPTSSSYLEWSDTRIVIKVPEDATSGLAYVETDQGRSNGVLFANAKQVPSGEIDEASSARPVVEKIEPASAAVGEVITLHGRRFGADRKGATVTFALTAAGDQRIAVSEHPDAYEYWSSGEIRVRVPDGAVSGPVMVTTARGRSASQDISIDHPVGNKRFVDRRRHALAASVTLDSVQFSEDGETGTVFLWVPRIARSPEQRNHKTLTESESPLFSPASGASLYRIRNLGAEKTWFFRRSVLVDRYAVEADVNPNAVPVQYDQSDEFMRHYTQSNAVLPVDADAVVSVAQRLMGTSRSPYARALNTYNYVVSSISAVEQVGPIGPLEALRDGEANSHGYATLSVALLRAQDIPARLISGYLVGEGESLCRHYWAEFYIEDFGWVPMDPAAADGAVCEGVHRPENPGQYYFGNTDSRRVAYSKGLAEVPRMHPEGRTERVGTMYALQTHHQEAVGDIRWYRVRWHDVEYLGKY